MKLLWHDQPDLAVTKKCRELEMIRRKDGESAYWQVTREVLKTDPWFLMRVALEWGWLDDQLVGHEFVRHIAENPKTDLGVLFPRGHGKTLPMSAIMITAILQNPNIAILEMSRTDDNAEKIGSFISEVLIGNDYLQRCFSRKHNPDTGFLPSSTSECKQWGKDGYTLPWRKPRLDPTLLTIPLKGAKAGKHPDIVWIDDPTEKENNNERGWHEVISAVQGLWFLVPAHGYMLWTGTRWHDADPLGMAEAGFLTGKQGPFKFIKKSCYIDDDPKKEPTYPLKKRWNMAEESGYTHKMLEDKRRPEPDGLGEFFDAQMRNDPAPAERADIKVADIRIYDPKDLPRLMPPSMFGIETTGGGLPIYNGFVDYLDGLKLTLPLVEITNPKKQGTSKRDRIVAALQPITSRGGLLCQQWMIGDKQSTEGLGYELRRIGKAAHDDIADALHNVPAHLCTPGSYPTRPEDPAEVYISCDLAWAEEKRSDFTVVMAVAVDHRGDHWVLDYDRFQISSPTAIHQRLLEFYQKHAKVNNVSRGSNRKFPGAWR